MSKRLFLLLVFATSTHAFSIPSSSKQLLVVRTSHNLQTKAFLYAYEKNTHQTWIKVMGPFPVSLGRNGVATGLGLQNSSFTNPKVKNKVEGDGKSPLGLFELTQVFGYSQSIKNIHMPYLHATTNLHCVDDSKSKLYNQLVHAQKGYISHEVMKRTDNLYEYGVLINHNPANISNNGSCIFLHIMHPQNKATAGCTALKKKDLLRLIKWLDSRKKPLLLQYLKDSHEQPNFNTDKQHMPQL